MKTKLLFPAVFAFLIFNFSFTTFGQGALTPPGAPAPTMRTLDEIFQKAGTSESRVDVLTLSSNATALHVITQPGSYYLSSNLVGVAGQNGIAISASDVTLDLNGFTLFGATNQTAILITIAALRDISVRAGRISGWGYGVISIGSPLNVVTSDLQITLVGGGFGYGISAGAGLRASRCLIQNQNPAGGFGINCGNNSVIESCQLLRTGGGVLCGTNSVVRGCQVLDSTNSFGIVSLGGSFIADNIIKGCGGGINTGSGGPIIVLQNLVQGCVNNDAIYLASSGGRVENNQIIGNAGYGVTSGINTSNNLVIRNVASNNSFGNYDNSNPKLLLGPLVTTSGVITNSNPWANFSF